MFSIMWLTLQQIFEEKVFNRRKVEFNRLGGEREESRKQEREKMRKLKHYLRLEEQRQQKLNEEEEARKHEGNHF